MIIIARCIPSPPSPSAAHTSPHFPSLLFPFPLSGIAIGFAAKEICTNFFGGLVLFATQPFVVGNNIKVREKGNNIKVKERVRRGEGGNEETTVVERWVIHCRKE